MLEKKIDFQGNQNFSTLQLLGEDQQILSNVMHINMLELLVNKTLMSVNNGKSPANKHFNSLNMTRIFLKNSQNKNMIELLDRESIFHTSRNVKLYPS